MSDEQILYISPEEDLTSVRQRLAQATGKQLTLVIPSQTQLRSHVAWKLLQEQAKKGGKEILIVSSDPQIRSVAHAVKFRVAHSMEAPPTNAKARTSASRPSRQMSRAPKPTESSDLSSRQSGKLNKPVVPHSSRPLSPQQQRNSRPLGRPSRVLLTPEVPPIRPLNASHLEEDTDLLFEDFRQAQHIREAALQGQFPATSNNTIAMDEPGAPQNEHPLKQLEDKLPPSQKEQRGRVSAFGFEQSWVEPTPEDEQDQVGPARSPVRPHTSRRGPTNRNNFFPPVQDMEDEEALAPPEEVSPFQQGMSMHVKAAPSRLAGNQDAIKGIQLTTPIPVVRPGMPSKALAPVTPTPKSKPVSRNLSVASRKPPADSLSRGTSPSRRIPPSRRPVRKRNWGNWTTILIAIALLIVIGGLAYFGPHATVTLTLQSRPYNQDLNLLVDLNADMPANADPALAGHITAKTQSQNFSKDGKLDVTGKKKEGRNAATGSVRFTNQGSNTVTVPSNTIITTSDGTQFVTEAEITLAKRDSTIGSSVPVDVHAVLQGDTGNVEPNTITVIPSNSVNIILQVNNGLAANDLNIKVTNEKATSGGGLIDVPAVQKEDLEKVHKALLEQVQGDIDNWIKQLDQQGLTGNKKVTDTLANPPQEGQIVESGSMPITLNVVVTVFFVPQADLTQAVKDALDKKLTNDTTLSGNHVLADSQHLIQTNEVKVNPKDDLSLTVTLKATAQIAANISDESIRDLIVGKGRGEAEGILTSQVSGIQKAEVSVSPGFVSWITFFKPNIEVQLVPGTPPPSTN